MPDNDPNLSDPSAYDLVPVDHTPQFAAAPIPKAGQTVQQPNVVGDISSMPGKVASAVGDVTGVSDAYKAATGQMTPEEAQMFALGALPMLAGGPEAKVAGKAVGELAPEVSNIWWHGTASGDLRGGASGLHLGTKDAATQALEARIGTPADGRGWVGDVPYGKTLLAGRDTLSQMDPRGYNLTGFRAASNYPTEDFYAEDYFKQNPKEWPKYPDGSRMPLTVTPAVKPFKLTGDMSNTPETAYQDFKANGYMTGAIKRGNPKNGYYYTNQGEDAGSTSIVVPNGGHIEPIQQAAPQSQGTGLVAGGASHFSTVPVDHQPDFGNQQQGMATGGSVKATKTQANYRGGTAKKKCELCLMFVTPSGCTAVKGHISRLALCDFYEPRKKGKDKGVKIDATHDGPWMSCMSIDGGTMYRNKNIPATANIKGKTVDVDDMLLHHEVPERDDLEKLIAEFKARFHREPNKNERKAIYLKAHNRSGTPNERAHAKKIDVDWKAWSAWCRGEESKIEKMKFTNQPKDADVKPIPHSHGDLEAMDHANAA